MPMIDVIVPSYQRPEDLARCLAALRNQSLADHRIIVVVRDTDSKTQALVDSARLDNPKIHSATVSAPGLIAAMQTGLEYASSEYVVFTDDDSIAPAHWLAGICEVFKQHPSVGAVGGPDILYLEGKLLYPDTKPVDKIGVVTPTGRAFGNHHCFPIQSPLEVQVLKGVNMAYRTHLIKAHKIGEGLRGKGSAPCTEWGICHRVLSQGYIVRFDGNLSLEHHIGSRPAHDHRTDPESQFTLDLAYNNAYVMGRYVSFFPGLASLVRGLFLGSRKKPGMLLILLKLDFGQPAVNAARRFSLGVEGYVQGLIARFA